MLQQIPGKGMSIVATQDMLPGTVILVEEPIFLMTHQFQKQCASKSDPLDVICGRYTVWLQESAVNQQKVLDLFGPINFPEMVQLGEALRATRGNRFTDAEIANIVKVASIVKFNAFNTGDSAEKCDHTLFELTSRFNHSCVPNCFSDFVNHRCTVRTILPVTAGEELTIEYSTLARDKPTHVRRHKYLTSYRFTCHCPRCDAPGDEMRQFSCLDSGCIGRMYACQPRNRDAEQYVDYSLCPYDIPYVEPRLLSCTVCLVAPTAEYQNAMFRLEEEK